MATFEIYIIERSRPDAAVAVDVLSPTDASDASRDYVLMCAHVLYKSKRYVWHIRPYDA